MACLCPAGSAKGSYGCSWEPLPLGAGECPGPLPPPGVLAHRTAVPGYGSVVAQLCPSGAGEGEPGHQGTKQVRATKLMLENNMHLQFCCSEHGKPYPIKQKSKPKQTGRTGTRRNKRWFSVGSSQNRWSEQQCYAFWWFVCSFKVFPSQLEQIRSTGTSGRVQTRFLNVAWNFFQAHEIYIEMPLSI